MGGRQQESGTYEATFRLLSHQFSVRTTSSSIATVVERTFGAFRVDAAPGIPAYTLTEDLAPDPPRFRVGLDGSDVLDTEAPGRAIDFFVWDVMRAVTDRCTDLLLLHAGVVANDAGAILLPATSGSGKTTLVAGLVDAGFAYLSDEVAAIDPATLVVRGFPVALSVKHGSFAVLSHLLPDLPSSVRRFLDGRLPLRPDDIRRDALGGPAPLRLVVSPRYEPGAVTRLRPCSRAQALADVATNAFNLERFGRRGFDLLARLVEPAASYRLVVGDLDAAVAAINALAADAPSRAAS
ncbi:MAG TPA: hypothetical protein VHF25_05195 [Nitriliruptorales bacterium]|nr:hypothetical protein [Nitriliruptorales bacterium]